MLLVAFAALVAIFFFRLVFLQVIVADQYAAQAEESRTVSFDTTPRRGTIYDRNGIVLATSVDATTIYANPVEVTDAAAEAQALAGILGGEAADYQELLSTPSTTFVYIKRQADVEAADKVKELKLDGIYFIADTRREYPHGSVGAQVIGFCNADGEGITGLELQYNDILCGTPGRYVGERGEQGFPIPGGVKEEVAAIDGTDIMISLDIKLQDTVEQALADGAFALALGLPLHLGVPPFITGSKLVAKVLTEDMADLTGGRVIVDGDGKSAANTLEAIIEEKRKALNI